MPLVPAAVIFIVPCVAAGAILFWSAWSNHRKTKGISLIEAVDRLRQREALMLRHLFRINPDPKGKKIQGFSNDSFGGKYDSQK